MLYFLPLEPVAMREEVEDGAPGMLGVAPVVADPGGVLFESAVTNMTEIKFEPPETAACLSLFR